MRYLDCWASVAKALFSQALAGEPELAESELEAQAGESFVFTAVLTGEEEGRFSIALDASLLDAPLLGEGVDQREGWGELLREVADAAAGELLAKTGRESRIESFGTNSGETAFTNAFQLKSTSGRWTILVRDELHEPEKLNDPRPEEVLSPASTACSAPPSGISCGIELLLDVELEATLRFGCRELQLGEILDMGPGDVVELDRHAADPVDLIVGDKIVARGEVVLVNGNFGLRVTEVAAPRKRLESIRCLF
ncbi:MAG: flagellar motor switch protein FliN [Terracidiphilus sp.]